MRYFLFVLNIYLTILCQGYVQAPWRLPGGHPDLEDYFTYEDEPIEDYLEVFFDHPNLEDAFFDGERTPRGHPSADYLVSADQENSVKLFTTDCTQTCVLVVF